MLERMLRSDTYDDDDGLCWFLVEWMQFLKKKKYLPSFLGPQVPQASRRLAEKVLTNCANRLKTYLPEAVRWFGVPWENFSKIVVSICCPPLQEHQLVVNEKEVKSLIICFLSTLRFNFPHTCYFFFLSKLPQLLVIIVVLQLQIWLALKAFSQKKIFYPSG